MTNGEFLAALRDDGALTSAVIVWGGIGCVLLIGAAVWAIRRIRANRQPKRTPEEARLIGRLRAEGYLMAGLDEAEWNAYLTSHQLQPKRDRVDRLIDDALAEPGDDDPFDGLVHDHNDCWGDR